MELGGFGAQISLDRFYYMHTFSINFFSIFFSANIFCVVIVENLVFEMISIVDRAFSSHSGKIAYVFQYQ